jgi:hypothetical protein
MKSACVNLPREVGRVWLEWPFIGPTGALAASLVTASFIFLLFAVFGA